MTLRALPRLNPRVVSILATILNAASIPLYVLLAIWTTALVPRILAIVAASASGLVTINDGSLAIRPMEGKAPRIWLILHIVFSVVAIGAGGVPWLWMLFRGLGVRVGGQGLLGAGVGVWFVASAMQTAHLTTLLSPPIVDQQETLPFSTVVPQPSMTNMALLAAPQSDPVPSIESFPDQRTALTGLHELTGSSYSVNTTGFVFGADDHDARTVRSFATSHAPERRGRENSVPTIPDTPALTADSPALTMKSTMEPIRPILTMPPPMLPPPSPRKSIRLLGGHQSNGSTSSIVPHFSFHGRGLSLSRSRTHSRSPTRRAFSQLAHRSPTRLSFHKSGTQPPMFPPPGPPTAEEVGPGWDSWDTTDVRGAMWTKNMVAVRGERSASAGTVMTLGMLSMSGKSEGGGDSRPVSGQSWEFERMVEGLEVGGGIAY
ncbi:hypothetical protein YB2330_002219 [Saitoella coloradoensis]